MNREDMNMDKYIKAPLCDEDTRKLRAGDYVYITGIIIQQGMRLIKEWMNL